MANDGGDGPATGKVDLSSQKVHCNSKKAVNMQYDNRVLVIRPPIAISGHWIVQ